jgi:MFS family permease
MREAELVLSVRQDQLTLARRVVRPADSAALVSRTGRAPAVFWRLAVALTASRLGLFVVPFLAYYMVRGRHLGAAPVALIIMAFGAGWTVGQPAGGYLADRLGRRFMIVTGNVAAAAAYMGLGLARSVPDMAVLAFAVGATFDAWRPAAMAILAEAAGSDDRQRQKNMSMLYLAMNAPEVAGTIAAGLLAVTVGWMWLFTGNAIACAVFAVTAGLLVPRSRPPAGERRHSSRSALKDPLLMAFTVLTLLCLTVYQQSTYALPLRFAGTGIGPLGYAIIAAINPLTVTVIARPAQQWTDRLPPVRCFALGLALIGVGIALTGAGHGLTWYASVSVIWILGEIAIMGSGPALITGLAPSGREASYTGVWMSTFGLSAVTAAAAGAALIHAGGLRLLWMSCALAGLAAAAGCLLLSQPTARRRAVSLAIVKSPPAAPAVRPVVADDQAERQPVVVASGGGWCADRTADYW